MDLIRYQEVVRHSEMEVTPEEYKLDLKWCTAQLEVLYAFVTQVELLVAPVILVLPAS